MIFAARQNKWFLLGMLAIAALAVFTLQPAAAATTDNLSGFAWSDNVGWISFNDTNPPTGGAGYGVDVNNSATNPSVANLSGYAWVNPEDTNAGALLSPWMATDGTTKTDNIGWLSFNAADTNGCPSSPCQATLNKTTGQVSGWARFINLGGDAAFAGGWVHLRGSNYGVQVVGCQWSGDAWSDDYGWINFSSTSGVAYGITGSGDACVATFAYNVVAESPVSVTRPSTGEIAVPVELTITKTAGTTDELVSVVNVTGLPTGVLAEWGSSRCAPATGAPCRTNIILRVSSGVSVPPQTVTVQTRSASGVLDSATFSLALQQAVGYTFNLTANPTSIPLNTANVDGPPSTITVRRVTGTAASTNLTVSMLTPSFSAASGFNARLSQSSCTPSTVTDTCTTELRVSAQNTVANGPYIARIRGVSGVANDTVDVAVCVQFCSTYDFRVDAPSSTTTIIKSATVDVSANIAVRFTKLAGATNERITITSVTGPNGSALPDGVSTALVGANCAPGSMPCGVTRTLTVRPSTLPGTYTLTVNARAEGGRQHSDTFVVTIVAPPNPLIDFEVRPSDVTLTSYLTNVPSNVQIEWITPLNAIEQVRLTGVSFDDPNAAGIWASTLRTCTPNSTTRTCTIRLDFNAGYDVPDGDYVGEVCGVSVTSLQPDCGTFTVSVSIGNPTANLEGKESTGTSYVGGSISVTSGNDVDLQWTSTKAESCQLMREGVNVGTPGQTGNYTENNVTSPVDFSVRCINANSPTGVVDTFRIDVGSPPAAVTVDMKASISSSSGFVDAPASNPLNVTYGNPIWLRWSSTNATNCEVRLINSGNPAPGRLLTEYDTNTASELNTTSARRPRVSGGMTADARYTIECWNSSSRDIDEVVVDVGASIDLTGPGGCTTNCSADQNEKVPIEWDYDGPTTDQCQLVDNSGNVIQVGGSDRFDPDDETGTEVTLPSNGTSASYTLTCPGGLTDTINFTLNEIQCFSNFNFSGGTAPTAAFILQDNNSQNTFVANVTLNLNGMDEDDLRISYGQIRTDAAGEYVNVTSALGTVKMHISTMRHEFVRSLGGGLSEYRVILTLDNADIQPVGEFSMTLTAENINDSDCRESKTIEAYLSDQRENFGEQ